MPLRWPIGKKIVPVGDLGLPDGADFGMNWPDDIKPSLALMAGQGAGVGRIMQLNGLGSPAQQQAQRMTLHPLAAETATWTSPVIDVSNFRTALLLVGAGAYTGTSPTLTAKIINTDPLITYTHVLAQAATILSGSSGLVAVGAGVGAVQAGVFGVSGVSIVPLTDYIVVQCSIGGTNPVVPFRALLFLQ